MKKIIWIDDSVSKMKRISSGLFRYLWENDFSNEILFLGDGYKEDGSALSITLETIEELYQDIIDEFRTFCYCYYKGDESGLGSSSGLTLGQVYKKFETLQPERPLDLNQNNNTETVVSKILERAKDSESYIGLDIRLNRGDIILEDKTQTMELFYHFSKLKRECKQPNIVIFLFSKFDDQSKETNAWEKKFREKYQDFPSEEKMIVFPRNKLVDTDSDSGKARQDFSDFLGIPSVPEVGK
jgi:hypothetical protein